MAGGRRGYRLSVASGDQPWIGLFVPGEVIVDAELGILLRWTSCSGARPVTRYELRDVATGPGEPGDFRADIPAGARVVEESDDPPGPVNIPAKLAAHIARQVAKDAGSAVRCFLSVIRGKDAR